MNIFIIAEAGVNHNGCLKLAKKLIDVAVDAGADAIKFQTFKTDKLVSKTAQKAEYQQQTTNAAESQHEMIKKLELDEVAHHELIAYCKTKNILFLSTPFDHESIELLDSLGMEIFKIPSGEITNLPYLRHIGKLAKTAILSTGMADLGEIEDALNILVGAGLPKEKITVLHATTEYPCPMEDVNLKSMQTITKVSAIRNIEKALGDSIKKPSKSEVKNIPIVRKSIVASRPIQKGEILSTENISVKRPGNGISPMRWDEILGTVAIKDYHEDELI